MGFQGCIFLLLSIICHNFSKSVTYDRTRQIVSLPHNDLFKSSIDAQISMYDLKQDQSC